MNCKVAREFIDQHVFDQNELLSQQVEKHTLTCVSCHDYLNESRESKLLLKSLKNSEPILNNPEELTNSILIGIENVPQEKAIESRKKVIQKSSFIILQRVFAAASVCLFLVFGFEQYEVINKIRKLEVIVNSTPSTINSPGVSRRDIIETRNISKSIFYSMIKKSDKKQIAAFLKNHPGGLTDGRSVQQQDRYFNSKFYKLLNH